MKGLMDVGDSVEIAKVQTSGCPEWCSGPQMEELRPPTVEGFGVRLHLRLTPCEHTIGGEYLDTREG